MSDKAKSIRISLTREEAHSLLEAIRIGFEDGSLEGWGKDASKAEGKLKRALANPGGPNAG